MVTTHHVRIGSKIKVKNASKSILLVFSSLTFALAIVELLLRLTGYTYPAGWYVFNREIGATLRPELVGIYTLEGNGKIEINKLGFRDINHPLKKGVNKIRVAVLGDSYAEALQVNREQAFWSVLQKEVKSSCGVELEVLNFGISGQGTLQQLETYRHFVRPFSPDIVLLAFLTGNDIRNNSKNLNADNSRPYAKIINGQLVIDSSFSDTLKAKLKGSFFYKYVTGILRTFRTTQLIFAIHSRFRQHTISQAVNGNFEPGLDHAVYQKQISGTWREAWMVTEVALATLAKEATNDHAEFLMVSLSNGIQVHPDPDFRAKVKNTLGVETLFFPEEQLTKISVKYNLRYLELARKLQTLATNNREFLHGFNNTALGLGHWNAKGHLHAGRLIGQEICTSGILTL